MFKLFLISKNFKVSYDFHKGEEAFKYVNEFMEKLSEKIGVEYKYISSNGWHFFEGKALKSFIICKYDGSMNDYRFLIEPAD